jgi:hypothetical protein
MIEKRRPVVGEGWSHLRAELKDARFG